jgi:hypothetical protein
VIDVPAGHLFLGEHLDPETRKRNGDPVLLEAADLTTHGVIVGMTGSGKTGLGVVLVEEALLVPLDIVGGLDAPAEGADPETVADEVEGYVSGLLTMVGIEADPLAGKEHILLSNLIHHAWWAGHGIDLAGLVGQVQDPPLRKLGIYELDAFYPAKERSKLAATLNGLLASHSFAAWAEGRDIDLDRLLHAQDGKRPACAIVALSHLSDQERQFVVSLLLGKLITWMRRQPGTDRLRVLLYFDEVMGFVPPTAMPPAKKPILTLFKTARAFGVGLVLATQNPVDVDYKGLSNAGTWMIGRLQTEQDKARLLDGLTSAGGSVDSTDVGDAIGGLDKREFMLRERGREAPALFTTRWAMSYLRGPLTREQISTLMQGRHRPSAPTAEPAPTAATARAAATAPAAATDGTAPTGDDAAETVPVAPTVAEDVPVRWLAPDAPWAAQGRGGPQRDQAGAIAGDTGVPALRRRQARPAGDRGVGGGAVRARRHRRPGRLHQRGP